MATTETITATKRSSTLKEFIASLSTITGDLSSITAPPFILADRSAVEYPASWAENPSILCAPSREEDPKERARLVLRWYLASLRRQQYASGNEDGGIKKPLNPFLGELFLGQWQDEAGTTLLVSEQVSHHPPVTACYISNNESGIQAEGYTSQEITLSKTGTVSIRQIGHAVISLSSYNEEYLVTLPDVQVRGILTGSPYPELTGKAYIVGSNGYVSEIDFSGKTLGGIVGKKNRVEALLYHRDEGKEQPIYTVSGYWNDKIEFTNTKDNTEVETLDVPSLQPSELQVASIEDQDPWESRRAWADVIDAIREGDMQQISNSKSKLEQSQREQRSRREQQQEEWTPLFFEKSQNDRVFEQLADEVGHDYGYETSGGVWKFDGEKAQTIKKPFRGNAVP